MGQLKKKKNLQAYYQANPLQKKKKKKSEALQHICLFACTICSKQKQKNSQTKAYTKNQISKLLDYNVIWKIL